MRGTRIRHCKLGDKVIVIVVVIYFNYSYPGKKGELFGTLCFLLYHYKHDFSVPALV